MTDRTEPGLGAIVEALRGTPEFLAGWLAHSPEDSIAIASELGIDHDRMNQLLLCRAPRPDNFAEDVTSIAEYLGTDAQRLARVLRRAAALSALLVASQSEGWQPDSDSQRGLLAAAQDSVEATASPKKQTGKARNRAEAVRRSAAKALAAHLDLEALIAWVSPLAVVSLPRLSIVSARDWLRERSIVMGLETGDRPLRGLLVAWRGSGIVFVDGTLPAPDRRLILAHEFGHFLFDYLEPRRDVLNAAPELLDVLDGYRAPTQRDRARAAVDGLPLGVQTHMLARSEHGGASVEVEHAEDLASQFAIELLSPWDNLLQSLRASVDLDLPWASLVEDAAAVIENEYQLPAEAAALRARAGLNALGRSRGFFER